MPCERKKGIEFTIYGASHAPAVGIRATGIPAGERIDPAALQRFMLRRAPGRGELSTTRREDDVPAFISGVTDGLTDGNELVIEIKNTDARSRDYDALRDVPRPGHADYAVWLRSGGREDMRGGGRYSGRMTAPLCALGGICLQILARRGISVCAHVLSVDGISDRPFDPMGGDRPLFDSVQTRELPVLDEKAGMAMKNAILQAKADGDSLGGMVECMICGAAPGLGGALTDGIESAIAALVFTVPAVKGVEFGTVKPRGSENNDPYRMIGGVPLPVSNNAGGILGGISTGLPIVFRARIKPTPSIARTQQSVDMRTGEDVELSVPGRHDPCILPRAVPVMEAAAAIAILGIMERENDG